MVLIKPVAMVKATMEGEKSQPIKKFDRNKANRTMYTRIKLCMMKKTMELAMLCGIKACTVCFGPNGVTETWPKDPSEVKSVVEEYFSGYDKDRRGKKESSVEEEVGAVAVAVEKRDWSDDNWLMGLSRDCLTKFLKDLDLKLQVVRVGIEFLNHQQDNQDAVMHETPEIIGSSCIGGSGGLSVSVWSDSDPFDLAILVGGGSGGLRCGSGGLPVSVWSDSDPFDLAILGGGGSGGLRCGSGSFPVSVCSDSDSFDLRILGGGGSGGLRCGSGSLPVSVCSDSDSLDLAILGGGGSDGLLCGSGGLPVSVCSDSESGGLPVSVCSDSDSFDLAIFGGGGSGGLPVSIFSNSDPFDLAILGGGGSGGLHVWSNSDPSNLAVLVDDCVGGSSGGLPVLFDSYPSNLAILGGDGGSKFSYYFP